MTSTALQLQKFKSVDQLLTPRGSNIYNSGIRDNDKGYVRYAHPSSTNPNLIIATPIYDDNRNVIQPGYYELVLSEDRQMLILGQNGDMVATIPVFKVEEDRSNTPVAQPMDNKSQKKADKAQKKKDKEQKKLIREGQMVEKPAIYSNATIQYDEGGDYYLIKYERGNVRAWGAIKE